MINRYGPGHMSETGLKGERNKTGIFVLHADHAAEIERLERERNAADDLRAEEAYYEVGGVPLLWKDRAEAAEAKSAELERERDEAQFLLHKAIEGPWTVRDLQVARDILNKARKS